MWRTQLPDQDDTAFVQLSIPAPPALTRAGCTGLVQVALAAIDIRHGTGPTGITVRRDALEESADRRSTTSAGRGFRWSA
jgi:hypothetical protein